MAGRPRKPTAVRILEGNPGKRPLPALEPPSEPVANLDPPDDLDALEYSIWTRYAPLLSRMGVLGQENIHGFRALCIHVAGFERAAAELRERRARGESDYFSTAKGFLLAHPLVKSYKMYSELAVRSMREFGMTPSSRAGLSIPVEKEDDEFNRMLAQAKALRVARPWPQTKKEY